MDTYFICWFTGFVDGEGCFALNLNQRRRYVPQPRFDLTLREDDTPTLEMIRDTLGFGQVYSRKYNYINQQGYKSNPGASFSVWNKADCLRLVNLLEEFPLRSKKAQDFSLWAEAVKLWNSNPKTGRWNLNDPQLKAAADRMRELYDEIRKVRQFRPYAKT